MCWIELLSLKYPKCTYTLFSLVLGLRVNLKEKKTTLYLHLLHRALKGGGLRSKLYTKGFKIDSISLNFL